MQKIFQSPLLKVYGNLKMNFIFPTFLFADIILLPLDFSSDSMSCSIIIQEDEILSESTHIVDVVTFFLDSVNRFLSLNLQAAME